MNTPSACALPRWAVALCLAVFTALAGYAQEASLPNVILIVADDLAPGEIGVYGQTNVPTPNLDRLAREGARFDRAYSGSPHEAAARASILTGRHSGTSPFRSEHQMPLRPDDVTIAEVLRVRNYRCVALGKWGLGWEGTTGEPRRQGFEEWAGYLESRDALNPYPTRLWRNEEPYTPWKNRAGEAHVHSHDLFVLAATNLMRFDPDRPFFTYLASPLPLAHTPMTRQGPGATEASRFAARPWGQTDRRRADALTRLDAAIGSLFTGLERARMQSRTLVLFTSDQPATGTNRFSFGAAPSSGANPEPVLAEEALRVPLFLWWPGRIRGGQVIETPVAHWDLLPTIADAARTRLPPDIDGTSLMPLVRTPGTNLAPRVLYWERHAGTATARAAMSGQWKAVELPGSKGLVLHDITVDPLQNTDLARLKPEALEPLKGALDRFRRDWTPPTNRPPTPPWEASGATNASLAR